MYFALRNLKEHADDTLIEMNWLKDLFIELMEMMFDMILDKEETSKITDENFPDEWCGKYIQVHAFSFCRISFDTHTLNLPFSFSQSNSSNNQSCAS